MDRAFAEVHPALTEQVFKTGIILGLMKPISFQNFILIIYPELVSVA